MPLLSVLKCLTTINKTLIVLQVRQWESFVPQNPFHGAANSKAHKKLDLKVLRQSVSFNPGRS
jgi:hypothetical protein